MTDLRETMNRALDTLAKTAYPPVDVYRLDNAVVIKTAPIDGLKPETVDVSMIGQELTLRGDTQVTEDIPQEAYLRRERRFEGFNRTITIPVRVKATEATARVKHGVLTIRLPLVAADRSEIIDVQIAT